MPAPSSHDPWPQWFAAAGRSRIDRHIRQLYHDLDAAVAERGPTCWISGRCCNFDAYQHRLYVTGLEIAWFLRQNHPQHFLPATDPQPESRPLPILDDPLPPACPYQINNLCSTHATRPMGCRIFFCQAGTEHWQQQLYEQFLHQLRQLHDRMNLPYAYMEWRHGLRDALATAPQP